MIHILLATALLTSSPADQCDPLQGWEQIEEQARGRFLIFGETHGTEQSPYAFGEYICAISKPNGDETGDSVLIAIEFSINDDANFRKAWEASEENFIKEITNNISDWKDREDGVASEAMLKSLKRLHTLKSRGHNIDITAFNGTKNEEQRKKFSNLAGQGPHEAAQAENINNAAKKDYYDHVVILVGSLHGQKTTENWGSGDFAPMAMKLAETEKTISLRQFDLGGTNWGCFLRNTDHNENHSDIKPEDIICKSSNSNKPTGKITGEPRMSLWKEDHLDYDPGYDGYYFVGPITASQPAGRKSEY